jgi:hypothetical protein
MKTLVMILALTLSQAYAAKFKSIKKMTTWDFTQEIMNEFCKGAPMDCYVNAYKIISKSPSEKWENTVKQILRTNSYVDGADAKIVRRDSFGSMVNEMAEAAGIDPQGNQADMLHERLSNDLDSRELKLVQGGISSPWGSHSIMALIDTENNEILILGAGYSE